MALDVLEIEKLLEQESLLEFNQQQLKETKSKPNFDYYKQQFMERGHEAEFLKLISSFDPKFHSVLDLKERQQSADQIKQELKEFKQQVESKKMDCQGLILSISKSHNINRTRRERPCKGRSDSKYWNRPPKRGRL